MEGIQKAWDLAEDASRGLEKLQNEYKGADELNKSCRKVIWLMREVFKDCPVDLEDIQVEVTKITQVLERVRQLEEDLCKEEPVGFWRRLFCSSMWCYKVSEPPQQEERFRRKKDDMDHVLGVLTTKLKMPSPDHAQTFGESFEDKQVLKLQSKYPNLVCKEAVKSIKPFELSLDEETVVYYGGREIGRGRDTVVLPGKIFTETGEERDVAIKFSWAGSKNKAADLKTEIDLLQRMPAHKNIIYPYGGQVVMPHNQEDDYKVYVIMERMHMNLEQYIFREDFQRRCTFEDLIQIFVGICDGLQFLHERKILHHDLKLQNILVSREGVVKIADFNCSKTLPEGRKSITASCTGTLEYMAPEILGAVSYKSSTFRCSDSIDVYSLGVIFWECLNFSKLSKVTEEEMKGRKDMCESIVWPALFEEARQMPCRGPSCLARLIEECLRFTGFQGNNTHNRPSARELYTRLEAMLMTQEPWLRKHVMGFQEMP